MIYLYLKVTEVPIQRSEWISVISGVYVIVGIAFKVTWENACQICKIVPGSDTGVPEYS